MSKLILQGENGSSNEFLLDHERVTIGRKAHSDIHLNDPAVSGNHAVIITLGSDSFLEDLDSTNGTKVNGNGIRRCVLQDGDEIRIAHFKFTFISEALEASHAEKKIAATPRKSPPPHASALDEITRAPELTSFNPTNPLGMASHNETFEHAKRTPGSGSLGMLKINTGPGAGQTLELSKPVITLGKPGIQVAAISLRDGQYYLGLVEGTELPLINGKEIETMPCQLQHRDVLSITGITLEFTLK